MSPSTGRERRDALSAGERGDYDCVILDLGLPDMTGFQLIQQINRKLRARDIPVIVYTGEDLTRPRKSRLKGWAASSS